MGRRKIEMEMVKDKGLRQVTFSKRRSGMFKKANELATLCGAQVATVVFSPGGKPFSFGHPSVEAVAQRFLSQEATPKFSIPGGRLVDSQQERLLTEQLDGLLRQIEDEKRRGEVLEQAYKASTGKDKFDEKPIDELNKEELLEMMKSMAKLHEKLKERTSDMEASSALLLLSGNPAKLADNE